MNKHMKAFGFLVLSLVALAALASIAANGQTDSQPEQSVIRLRRRKFAAGLIIGQRRSVPKISIA